MAFVEAYGPATYGDAFADVYDLWYDDPAEVAAAVATLAELADRSGVRSVLELGVGTGRLAVPLAAIGVEVWGLDASPAMLARLRARPGGELVHAREGDIADPRRALGVSDGRFGVVVAAFNTLFLLVDREDQRRCLAGSAALVAPGGAVVVEAFVPASPLAGVGAESVVSPSRVTSGGVVLTVSEHRPAEQLVIGQHVEVRHTAVLLRPWRIRYATPDQLDELAASVGLERRARWGGWDQCGFDDTASGHVSVYARR
ncbi:MAG: class I SAM-dependent DNA methyltransferase [Acidimicrobiales bacterium]